MKNIWLLGLLAFFGCTGGKDDTGDTSETDADTDADSDTDTDADINVTVNWATSGVTIAISNGNTAGYDFGMAETGSDAGWYGEDCIYDPDDELDYGYEICHGISASGGTLTVADPYEADSVVAGETTLFTDSLADNITYVLFEADTDVCWTWGEDVSYYSAFGCTETSF
jgi:hypothetical protein